jgi:hypothetical protein
MGDTLPGKRRGVEKSLARPVEIPGTLRPAPDLVSELGHPQR